MVGVGGCGEVRGVGVRSYSGVSVALGSGCKCDGCWAVRMQCVVKGGVWCVGVRCGGVMV